MATRARRDMTQHSLRRAPPSTRSQLALIRLVISSNYPGLPDMKTLDRVARHMRITALSYQRLPRPPFLVLFINSVCNMKCDHCFYWRSLNDKNDLTTAQIFELSHSLGRVENLNLSGG